MVVEVRCKLCGERWIEHGKSQSRDGFVKHIRKVHPAVILLEDIMIIDKDFWKAATREGNGDVTQSQA